MLEVKVSINGSPIKILYAHNLGPIDGVGKDYLYEWEAHSPFTFLPFLKGKLTHTRTDDAEVLVYKILGEVIDAKTKEPKSKKL